MDSNWASSSIELLYILQANSLLLSSSFNNVQRVDIRPLLTLKLYFEALDQRNNSYLCVHENNSLWRYEQINVLHR